MSPASSTGRVPQASASTSAPTAATAAPATTALANGPPCDAAALLAELRRAGVDTTGATLGRIACTDEFAGATVQVAARLDRLAVFQVDAARWQFLRVGESFVCQPLEIPDPDYTAIGCAPYDR